MTSLTYVLLNIVAPAVLAFALLAQVTPLEARQALRRARNKQPLN